MHAHAIRIIKNYPQRMPGSFGKMENLYYLIAPTMLSVENAEKSESPLIPCLSPMPIRLLRYASNQEDVVDSCNDVLVGYLKLRVTSCR